MSVSYRVVTKENVCDLVELHRNSYLADHFSNLLSEDLLKEYYLGLTKPFNELSFLMFVDDQAVGFVVGGRDLNSLVKEFVRKNTFKIASLLLRNPRFLLPKLKAFFTRFSKDTWKSKADIRILSVAISDQEQKKGYGRLIIEEFERKLAEVSNGEELIYGLSVKNSNSGGIEFYMKLGFTLERNDGKSSYFRKSI